MEEYYYSTRRIGAVLRVARTWCRATAHTLSLVLVGVSFFFVSAGFAQAKGSSPIFWGALIMLPVAAHSQSAASASAVVASTKELSHSSGGSTTTVPQSRQAAVGAQPAIGIANAQPLVSSGGISEATLDQKIAQLDSKFSAQLSSLSLLTSQELTGAYQAASYAAPATVVNTNPPFTGGTITSLSVSGAATSSFAGGIALASGCFSVNGVCITAGGGGASLSAANTWSALQSFANASTTLGTLTTGWATNWNATYASSTALTVSGNTYLGAVNVTGNTTLANATTTALFSTTASSTNLFSQTASIGSLSLGSTLTTAGLVTLSGGYIDTASSTHTAFTQLSNASTTQLTDSGALWLTGATANSLLSTNASGQVVATSTIGNSQLQNSSVTVSSGSGLSGGGTVALGGSTSLSLNLANPNTWSGLQIFGNSSSTVASVFSTLYVGGSATSSIQGSTTGTSTIQGFLNVAGTNSTSTFSGALAATYLNITGTAATSTFANGISASEFSASNLGTAAAPAFAFGASANTGQFAPASGSLAWTTLGTEAARFTSGGLFGLGTTTPSWKLTVASSSGPQLALVDTTATSYAWTFRSTGNTLYIATSTALATSTYTSLTINPNGFVGVGTSTPGSIFSVNGILNLTSATSTLYSTGGINLTGGCFSIAGTCVGASGGTIGSGTQGQLPFYNAAGTTLTATSSIYLSQAGLFDIGSSTPITQLTVPGYATPVFVNATSSSINQPYGVYAQGRYVYVVSGTNNTLAIFDESNPAAPLKMSATTAGLANPQNVFVQGRYAYVANQNNASLVTFDISNAANPIELSSFTTGLLSPYFVYVQGRYAYVTNTGNATLEVVDVSNPASPVAVGTTTTGLNHPYGVFVQGRYAYVASNSNSSLVIFDISNPSTPTEVATISTGLSQPYEVYVQGRYAFVADQSNGLVAFDISNPTAPVEVGAATTGISGPYGVSVQGRYAYLASTGNASLVVVDVSNPASMTTVGSTNSNLSSPTNIVVQGRYAYLTSWGNSSLVSFDLGGGYAQSLEAGALEAGTLVIRDSVQALDGEFAGGLTVGNALNVGGTFNLTASTFNATTTAGKNYSLFSINTASSTSPLFSTLYNGNVGLGTSSPTALLGLQGGIGVASNQLYLGASGFISAGVTTQINLSRLGVAFAGSSANGIAVNDTSASNASQFMTFLSSGTQIGFISNNNNTGTAYNTTSDRRLKENIATTTAGLSTLMQIPVYDFDFISNPSVREQGFLAQALYPIYPEAVTTNGDNGIVPLSPTSTPWSVDYGRLTPLLVQSIEDIANVSSTFESNLIAWLGNSANGVHDLFAGNIHAQNELCVGNTCVTPAQFEAMVAAAGASQSGSTSNAAPSSPDSTSTPDTPPVIDVNQNNPAIIQVGATYTDQGATITGPQADLSLGIQVIVDDGATTSLSAIGIDTSVPGTHTIEYVATDQNGLEGAAERTVIVAPQSTSDVNASTTAATPTNK